MGASAGAAAANLTKLPTGRGRAHLSQRPVGSRRAAGDVSPTERGAAADGGKTV